MLLKRLKRMFLISSMLTVFLAIAYQDLSSARAALINIMVLALFHTIDTVKE